MPDARRKWWIAGLLSLLLPGLGQVYNGQAKKGVALHLVLVAIFALMALGVAAGVAFKPLVLMALVLSGACFVLTVTEACISARRRGADYVPVRYNTWKVYVPALLAYLVVVRPLEGHLTRCFVQAYHIPAGAMEDALLVGDYLLADKFVYGAAVDIPGTDIDLFRLPARREPRAGDVIIFRSPVDPSRDLIKRCVAVGGQTVELRDKVLYVDGHEVEDTPWSSIRTQPSTRPPSTRATTSAHFWCRMAPSSCWETTATIAPIVASGGPCPEGC